jgi:hypothetical protein
MFKVIVKGRLRSKQRSDGSSSKGSGRSSKGSGRSSKGSGFSGLSGSDASNQSSMQSPYAYASGSHIRSILKPAAECNDSSNSSSSNIPVLVRNISDSGSFTTDGTTRSSSAAAADSTIAANNVDKKKPPRKKSVRRVRWKNVHVREYERTLGDNPSCSSGAPVTYVAL